MFDGAINYMKGDATRPLGRGKQIIAHIVNDVGKFGAGFSGALDTRFKKIPSKSYAEWFREKEVLGIQFQLGAVLYTRVAGPRVMVAHMLAQHGVGTDRQRVDYDALTVCLFDLMRSARQEKASVHMPRIGTGLAGGTWAVIGSILKLAFEHADGGRQSVQVYVYDL